MGIRQFFQRRFCLIERRLRKWKWKGCADFTRGARKLFYFQSERNHQIRWQNKYCTVDHKIDTLFQREIYLLEEISFLENKKQRHVDDKDDETLIDVKFEFARETPEERQEASSKDNSRLEAMKKELSGISQRLFLLKERRGRLEFYPASGPWVDDFYKYRYDTCWDRTRPGCEERGGCCSRGCGCCRKPRQPSTGQRNSANGATSHCTVACGCCIRERGFYIPSSERLEEATDEWIGEWDLDWLINEVV